MGSFKYQVGTNTTFLSNSGAAPNTLASLAASGAGAISTTTFDNSDSANLYLWGDIELLFQYAVSPTAGQSLDVYLVPATDGTNYCDWTGSNTPASVVSPPEFLVGSFRVFANTSAHRLTLRNIVLPPTLFKLAIVNNGGQALATSGTTQSLKLLPYRGQY